MNTPVKVAVTVIALAVAGFGVVIAAVTGVIGAADYTVDCATGGTTSTVTWDGAPVAGLDATQTERAVQIINEGIRLGIPRKGLVVAIATARQESGLRNLASLANPASLAFPHDGVAPGDHDSVGLFQQRDAWGPMDVRMDPPPSARMFYTGGRLGQRGLLDVPGWQSMSVAEAAQAVQVSAYPSAYAQWESLAVSVVDAVTAAEDPSVVVAEPAAAPAPPPAANPAGPSGVKPHVARAAAYVRTTWGFNGPIGGYRFDPGSEHNSGLALDIMIDSGNPIEKPLGDQIAAYFAGPGATAWGVNNVIWMQRITNAGRDWRFPGDLMEDRKSYTANHYDHVHVDFHPQGGSGPIPAADTTGGGTAATDCGTATATTIGLPLADGAAVVASFNVLGHSHTVNGGRGRAPGPVRARALPGIFDTHKVSVALLQEFQRPQEAAFNRVTGGEWSLWHPPGKPANTVAWRTAHWTMVDHTSVTVPYFARPQPMPAVLLERNDTGGRAWFLSVHNPANVHGPAAHKRREAVDRELALIDRLDDTAPVVYGGDMNERDPFYCTVTAAGLHASNGGSNGNGPCRLPAKSRIDWITGTPEIEFSGYQQIRTPDVVRVTDHWLVLAGIQ